MMSNESVPLLLDTDIGDDVDDVFALLLAAREPRVQLLGITTVFGDVHQRARIAAKLLRLAGRSDVPVIAGEDTTLDGWFPGPVITSGQGFAAEPGEEPVEPTRPASSAARFIIDTVMQHPSPVTLVAIGPLTNVGAALQREPRLARRLRSLIMMGGRLGPEAQDGEHNINCDPFATRLVLESGAPLIIGTYDVTYQARLDSSDADRLRAGGLPPCVAAADQLALYLQQRQRTATSMYDPLTLTCAYTSAYLTTAPMRLSASYETRKVHMTASPDPTSHTLISTGLDAPGFRTHLLRTIGEAKD
ncbi:MAG: nucleoside hydrolase [Chloroflexi bacterium]|nr:nucleoside hydrolase [Chloroflexota bacterium]